VRTEALVQLRYDTGFHLSEVLKTTWRWLDLDEQMLTAPVSSLRSTADGEPDVCTFALSDDTVRVLSAHRQSRLGRDDNPVFTGPKRGQLPGDITRNTILNAAEAMEIRPHRVDDTRCEPGEFPAQTLRNSIAYKMLTIENRSLNEVNQFLRHSDMTTTKYRYRTWRHR
jgi:integrase